MKTILVQIACGLLVSLTASAAVRYVDLNNPNPLAPYATWATAATTVQDAIDATVAGDEVVVTNGVYATGGRAVFGTMTNRVVVDKAVSVRSVNGPHFTIIQGYQVPGTTNGDGAIRCAYLGHNGARLSGFTLKGGATRTAGDFNQEQRGGGLYFPFGVSAVASNCVIVGNSSPQSGAGVYRGTLYGCAIIRNGIGTYSDGANGSTLYNCTIVGNESRGADSCTLYNCIVYFNQPYNALSCTLNYSCTTPLPPEGIGNISLDPQLASFTYLSLASPCRGAGNDSYASGTDLDGEAWLSPPAMGCVEPGAAKGPLTVSFTTTMTTVTPSYPVSFTAYIEGRATASVWNFGDGVILSNQPFATHSWTQAGDYPVVLTAYNGANPAGVSSTTIVHVVAPIHHVSAANPNPLPPYSSWATAATNIQDAVDAATLPGAVVLVTNGVYATGGRAVHGTMTNRVAVDKLVHLRSVNGPQFTIIQGYQVPGTTNGNGAIRCVYLTNGASLSGFMLTNGATRAISDPIHYNESSGGGVRCEVISLFGMPPAFVTNCVIIGNSAYGAGGGVYGGYLVGCELRGNTAAFGGGVADARLSRCLIKNNVAMDGGGAGYYEFERYCRLDNCVVTGNRAEQNGGGTFGCRVTNSTLAGNIAGASGGGAFGFMPTFFYVRKTYLANSIVVSNTAPDSPNYNEFQDYYSEINFTCTTPLPPLGVGNITDAPNFVDFAAGDFRLQDNSPGVNVGNTSLVTGDTDLDGNPRVIGDAVDMGAYELQPLRPALRIKISADSILLAWPLWASDFELQQSGVFPPSADDWESVSTLPAIMGDENVVALPVEGQIKVFRLFKP